MFFSSPVRALLFSTLLVCSGIGPGQGGELRRGAAGSGEVISNSKGTIARRRTRPIKSKPTKTAAANADELFIQGDAYFERGQFAEAVKAYEAGIRLDPKYQDLYYALSDAYLKLGEESKSAAADQQGLDVAKAARSLVSSGVLNDKAINLPVPTTPPIARASRTSGTVVVQVLLNEDGDVITARALSGHPLLITAAVQAAIQAKFSQTILSGRPVKVVGTVNYEFTL